MGKHTWIIHKYYATFYKVFKVCYTSVLEPVNLTTVKCIHTKKSHTKLILCFFFNLAQGQEGQDNFENTFLRLTHFQQSLFCYNYFLIRYFLYLHFKCYPLF
jgi:hypothetical protein